MKVPTHIRVCTYIHMYIHTYIHTYAHIHMYMIQLSSDPTKNKLDCDLLKKPVVSKTIISWFTNCYKNQFYSNVHQYKNKWRAFSWLQIFFFPVLSSFFYSGYDVRVLLQLHGCHHPTHSVQTRFKWQRGAFWDGPRMRTCQIVHQECDEKRRRKMWQLDRKKWSCVQNPE